VKSVARSPEEDVHIIGLVRDMKTKRVIWKPHYCKMCEEIILDKCVHDTIKQKSKGLVIE